MYKNKDTNALGKFDVLVNSLDEALRLAMKWQKKEKFDLFRGQGRNWDLLSSIHRSKSHRQYEKDLERLDLLYYFMQSNHVLKEYIHNN